MSKWFLFSSFCQKHKEIFRQYILWGPGRNPGSKTHKSMRAPGDFNSHSHPHWASSNSSIIIQASPPWPWFLQRCLLVGFCSSKLRFSVSAYLSLPFGGKHSSLWLHFSKGSKESCWLFSLRFLLVVRMEWQLLSSLQVEPEARGLKHIFYLKKISAQFTYIKKIMIRSVWLFLFVFIKLVTKIEIPWYLM